MTEEERRIVGGNFVSEAQVVDLDGRRCLRIDESLPDSLDQLRLRQQTWYDLETCRPIRRRELLQLAEQIKYKHEYRTTTIAYVESGPADIYALGVPAGTPIVDEATLNNVNTPPALDEAFNVAARLLETFPCSVRVVEHGDSGLQLTYWSAPQGCFEGWAAFIRNPNQARSHGTGMRQSFFADHQGSSGIEIPRSNAAPAPRTTCPPTRWHRGYPSTGP